MFVEKQIRLATEIREIIIFDPRVYPPRADTTPMIVCKCCAIPNPPNVINQQGICLDCQYARRRPPDEQGSLALAMQRIRDENLRLPEILPELKNR